MLLDKGIFLGGETVSYLRITQPQSLPSPNVIFSIILLPLHVEADVTVFSDRLKLC